MPKYRVNTVRDSERRIFAPQVAAILEVSVPSEGSSSQVRIVSVDAPEWEASGDDQDVADSESDSCDADDASDANDEVEPDSTIEPPPSMHRRIAQAQQDETGVLEIARLGGLLGVELVEGWSSEDGDLPPLLLSGEPLDVWLQEFSRMRALIELWDSVRDLSNACYRKPRLRADRSKQQSLTRIRTSEAIDALARIRTAVRRLWELPETLIEFDPGLVARVNDAMCGPQDPGGSTGNDLLAMAVLPRGSRSRMVYDARLAQEKFYQRWLDLGRGMVVRTVNDMLRRQTFAQTDGVPGHGFTVLPKGLLGLAYMDFAAELHGGSKSEGVCPICGDKFTLRRSDQVYCSPSHAAKARSRRRAAKS